MPRQVKSLIVIRYSLFAKEKILCLLSALLLTLSFSNLNLEFLAWIGFVPLFFAVQNISKGKAFLFSYITGIIFWSGTIYWLIHVTLAGTILLILYLALYFGFFGLLFSYSKLKTHNSQLIFIPATWVLLEYLRGHLLTGFPWALLGYSQYKNLPVIQISDITGAWGVSFLVMMVNAAIYVIARRHVVPTKQSKREIASVPLAALGVPRNDRMVSLAMTIILLLIVLIYGYYKLHLSPITYHLSPALKISVIQGNIPQELKWAPGAQGYIIEKYSKLTRQAAEENPDLIVWPEASSPVIPGEDDLVFDRFLSLAGEIKTPILIGTVSKVEDNYFNSAILLDNQGLISGSYDKLHLVPFGEYIPLKKILPFLETVVPIGEIAPGREYKVFELQTPNSQLTTNFSVLICFEDLFLELSRHFVRKGAQFLINITNDAWYKKTSAAEQHLQASVFRAVENRVTLVRSANTGVSAFIAKDGRIISLIKDSLGRNIFVDGIDTQKIFIAKNNLTFYTKYGDIFIALIAIFVLLNIIFKKRL